MTFTATPEPPAGDVPPRIRLDLDVDPDVFATLTIKRDGKAIREQPFVGSTAALTYDYEAPFGVSVTYTATGTTIPAATADWTENWASLAAWSGATSDWAVTSGHAYTPSFGNGTITRDAAGEIGQLVVADPDNIRIALLDASNVQVALIAFSSIVTVHGTSDIATLVADNTVIGPSILGLDHSFTMTLSGNDIVVTGADGNWSRVDTFTGVPTKVALTRGVNNAFVESITVVPSTEPDDYSDSDTATLDVDGAWLIHPVQPTLSMEVEDSSHGNSAESIIHIDEPTRARRTASALRTLHWGVGRRRPVVVTNGPRAADEWDLVIHPQTFAATDDLRSLVDDQTPLLLRIPPAFGWHLPDDWYSVGDVTIDRDDVPEVSESAVVTLPLTPVDEPIVRQGAVRTWGDLLMEASTWADVLTIYDSWLGVLSGDQV